MVAISSDALFEAHRGEPQVRDCDDGGVDLECYSRDATSARAASDVLTLVEALYAALEWAIVRRERAAAIGRMSRLGLVETRRNATLDREPQRLVGVLVPGAEAR